MICALIAHDGSFPKSQLNDAGHWHHLMAGYFRLHYIGISLRYPWGTEHSWSITWLMGRVSYGDIRM